MRRSLTALAFVLAGLLSTAGVLASAASAEVPVENFGLLPSTAQAGGHPDLQVAFVLRNGKIQQLEEGLNTPCDCENPRFITLHAPKGLVGSPTNLPTCTAAQFGNLNCPVDSQVGIVEAGVQLTPADVASVIAPVYNMVPRPGEAGLFAFSGLGAPIFEVFSARTGGDYGLETKVSIPEFVVLRYSDQILWGTPADPNHDGLRFKADSERVGVGYLCDSSHVLATPSHSDLSAPLSGSASAAEVCNGFSPVTGAPSNSPLTPFTENPTSCEAPLQSGVDVLAYDGTTTHADAPFPPTIGCDQLSFNPSLAAKPTTTAADSPSGIDIDLSVPQYESPTVPSPSEIKATEMTLPEGFTVNPSAADGKSACADLAANIGTGSTDAANCPETAKIGTLEIHTALLPGPLPGYLYLGQPLPGNRYRVFLVADGFNVHVKLAGTIVPDKQTGRLSVIFENLPETPFADFTLHIFGSERGALATPTKCGTYPITTTFTPWDEVLGKQSSQTFFTIDQGPNGTPCPGATRPFNPGFQAGSTGNSAGAYSPFSFDLTRADGDQNLTGLSVATPLGFTANLKGIPYCPESAIDQLGNSLYSGLGELASPACPAASQIGTVIGGGGAGSRPVYLAGKVYLAGPYKGAPLSDVAVIPAVSGPYDLGNIAVRGALHVDPATARVTADTESLPQILEGIPLRARSIRVNIDRPGFALNPTNCDPHSVDATISGDEGAVSGQSSPYQVANCASLPFAPKLSLSLKGKSRRAGTPALKAVLTMPPGGANIAKAQVTLSHAESIDNAHIGAPCTRVQYAANSCPPSSVLGRARAETPLLDKPLEGPVYLMSGFGHVLPDVAADLGGQIHVFVHGRVDTGKGGGIRNTFEVVPDAPVSKFTLELLGGSKGLLENSENICSKPQHAFAQFTGQNGRVANLHPLIAVNGCGGKAKRKRHRGRGLLRARAVR